MYYIILLSCSNGVLSTRISLLIGTPARRQKGSKLVVKNQLISTHVAVFLGKGGWIVFVLITKVRVC